MQTLQTHTHLHTYTFTGTFSLERTLIFHTYLAVSEGISPYKQPDFWFSFPSVSDSCSVACSPPSYCTFNIIQKSFHYKILDKIEHFNQSSHAECSSNIECIVCNTNYSPVDMRFSHPVLCCSQLILLITPSWAL